MWCRCSIRLRDKIRWVFKTLEADDVSLWEYKTLTDGESRLSCFIEVVYNPKRLHSAWGEGGYCPPFFNAG